MTGADDTDRNGPAPASIDTVTGALTRAALAACLDRAIAQAGDAGGGCAVFLFDVDHFKSVNDVYGHSRGDAVLRQITERVTEVVRDTDVLIRYGGDEFVLVLPGTNRVGATDAATRLVEAVKGAPFPGSPPLSVSVSLGLATYPDDATAAAELIEVADRRNYLAKRRGRAVAVGDDLPDDDRGTAGRLLERDAALAAAQDFLVQLDGGTPGTLRVSGEPGAGHTRFLAEVAKLARLRGYTVRGAADRPDTGSARVLVVADAGDDPAEAVRALGGRDATPVALGLLQAVHEAPREDPPLPLAGEVTLPALSTGALTVWLRLTLQGEPSRTLVEWIARRSRGVIGRAVRALNRLRDRGGPEATSDGGWTIPAALLARADRARRPPEAFSTLIGRNREIKVLTALLADRRLVTLVGAGGIGKTRLALAVAHAAADDYLDGAVLVPLAAADTTDQVVSAVAQALEIAETPGEPLAATVLRHLADRELLLVLDNFEQVLSASTFVAELRSGAPGVTVIATSRERLRVSGEQVYPVPPLALPDVDHVPARPEDLAATLATSPALALFVTRAREAAYDLVLTPPDVRAAALVCHRLDGLPLAIELAAARCDTLTPVELYDQLTERLDLLADGPHDLPARQQTLRATIDWSFALLDADQQDLVTRLGVFAGGCTAEAAAAVCLPAGAARGTIDARLAALTDKNLLASVPTPHGVRFTMLETIRAYAAERLTTVGDAGAVRAAHAGYFAAFAERAGTNLRGPAQAAWLDRTSRDYLNVRAALEWTTSRGDHLTAGRIAFGLGDYWRSGRQIGEGRDWYRRILDDAAALPDHLRTRMLEMASFLAAIQCDVEQAFALGEESLRLARKLNDGSLISRALNVFALATELSGDFAASRDLHSEGLALALDRGDQELVVKHRGNLTLLALRLGDLDTAHGYALLNLDAERALGNLRGVALTLDCLGQVHLGQGDAEAAGPLLTESLRISRQLGDAFCEAHALHHLGLAAQLGGDRVTAHRQMTAGLRLSHEVGDQEGVISVLVDLAHLWEAAEPTRAATLLGAAEAVRTRCDLCDCPDLTTTRARQAAARVRARLGEPTHAAAWSTGRTTPLDQLADQLSAADLEYKDVSAPQA